MYSIYKRGERFNCIDNKYEFVAKIAFFPTEGPAFPQSYATTVIAGGEQRGNHISQLLYLVKGN